MSGRPGETVAAKRWFYPCFCTTCGAHFESTDKPEVCPDCEASHGIAVGPCTGVMPRNSEAPAVELEDALREARPYVFNAIDPRAPDHWRTQTAVSVLRRVDAALGRYPDIPPSPRDEGQPAEGKAR